MSLSLVWLWDKANTSLHPLFMTRLFSVTTLLLWGTESKSRWWAQVTVQCWYWMYANALGLFFCCISAFNHKMYTQNKIRFCQWERKWYGKNLKVKRTTEKKSKRLKNTWDSHRGGWDRSPAVLGPNWSLPLVYWFLHSLTARRQTHCRTHTHTQDKPL